MVETPKICKFGEMVVAARLELYREAPNKVEHMAEATVSVNESLPADAMAHTGPDTGTDEHLDGGTPEDEAQWDGNDGVVVATVGSGAGDQCTVACGTIAGDMTGASGQGESVTTPRRKRGRPVGSKNRPPVMAPSIAGPQQAQAVAGPASSVQTVPTSNRLNGEDVGGEGIVRRGNGFNSADCLNFCKAWVAQSSIGKG